MGHETEIWNLQRRTIWIVNVHRGDGKRFVVRADENLTAFVALESAICASLIRWVIMFRKDEEIVHILLDFESRAQYFLEKRSFLLHGNFLLRH